MWLYTLRLTDKIGADQIDADWKETRPDPENAWGVSQGGFDAVITSIPRVPGFEDFAAEVDYVESIEEHMEIPDPDSPDWDPPYVAHPSGSIEFVK